MTRFSDLSRLTSYTAVRLVLLSALALVVALAAAADAGAVTRAKAAEKAVAALGSEQGSDPVVVLGLTKPLGAGTRVTKLGRVGRGGAFLFYEDSGPFQAYPHAGRIALVGAKSGKVKLSATIGSRPLVNGNPPAFLTSAKRYRSSKYRVFSRLASDGPLFGNAPFASGASLAAAQNNHQPTANDQSVTVKQNSPKNITLTGSDPDGDPITFRITQQPNHGTLSGTPPNVTYTPDPNRLGPDHFFFVTNDGQLDSKAGKVTINVVPRGVPSMVTTSAGCTGYSEQAPAVVVDGQVVVVDPDDTTLDSGRVRIAANFQSGDELLFTNQNGISGSYDGSTGVLTLTGTASVADYQSALRSVRFQNLSSDNPSATKDVEFTVNDAGGDSLPATKQICITAINDAPVLDTTDTALSYTEGDGAVAVDTGIAASDPDSAQLQGATVQITSNFSSADDELAFTNQLGITGSYSDATGTLTLSGNASVADYQTALRAVTYENVSNNPSGSKTVSFQATDSGGAASNVATRDINLIGVNEAPVVTTSPGSTPYPEGGPSTQIDGSLTVTDADDTNLEGGQVRISAGFQSGDDLVFVNQNGISGVYNTGTGVLTLTGTASVATYQDALRSIGFRTTNDNPSSPKTIEFKVNDGEVDSAPATKDVEIIGNQAPALQTTATPLAYTTGDGPVAVDPDIGVDDPDSAISSATVQISSNFIAAEDELAFADQSGITGSYSDVTGTLTLTGTASVSDYQTALRSVTYENSSATPSPATRTVSFQVVDSHSNPSNVATRDIEINQVNEAPVVTTSPGPTAYASGDPSTAVDPALTVSDANDTNLASATVRISSGFEEGDLLTVEDRGGINSTYNPESGVLTLSGTSSVADYQATLRSVGYFNTANPSELSKTVEFQVNDGTADSNAATKTITVIPPPPPPPNLAPMVTTSEGSTTYTEGDPPTAVDPALTVSDLDDANIESATVRLSSGLEDGDALTFEDQAGIFGIYNPETGVLSLTGSASVADYQTALRSVGYFNTGNPSAEFKSVEFQVNDGDADSNAATKTIAVVGGQPAQAPVVTTSEGSTSYTLGDETGVVVDDALTVTDADDTNLEGGRVQIEGFEPGDELVFVDQAGIFGTFDTTTGGLDLVGTASVADYQTALRSIRFRHFGDNQSAFRSVAFRVNDGELDSNFALKRIDIIAP